MLTSFIQGFFYSIRWMETYSDSFVPPRCIGMVENGRVVLGHVGVSSTRTDDALRKRHQKQKMHFPTWSRMIKLMIINICTYLVVSLWMQRINKKYYIYIYIYIYIHTHVQYMLISCQIIIGWVTWSSFPFLSKMVSFTSMFFGADLEPFSNSARSSVK